MAAKAEINMFLYSGLFPEEEKVLKEMESEVGNVLCQNFIFERHVWTSEMDSSNSRIIKLIRMIEPPSVLLEFPSSEMASLSSEELLLRLKGNLR